MATNTPSSVAATIASAGKEKTTQQQFSLQQPSTVISPDILDDLGSRFIINVPENERNNLIRLCFQIELAHWFYLDFYCVAQKQKCGIKQFAFQLFQHIPFLQRHVNVVEIILENWKQYKLTVPTYGAILLSEDLKHVLLVQSFWAKSSWGFPKGKINENEEPVHCAIREVYEETGYDIKNLLVPTEFIELVINYQFTRLYLIRGVPISTVFAPRTRNEIKCCEWFPIDLLPVTKNDNFVKDNLSMNGNSFFMILPFVKRLKKWLEKVQKYKPKGAATGSPVFGSAGKQNNKFFENKTANMGNQSGGNRQRQRHKSMGDLEQQRSKSNGTQNLVSVEQQISKYTPKGNANRDTGVGDLPDVGSASGKKYGKKQLIADSESAISAQLAGNRTQTKRKLFDSVAEDGQEKVVEVNKPVPVTHLSTDPLAMFDVCQAWANFKFDYSKFV